MSKRDARGVALERRICRIDATAKDAGHVIESWETEETDGASLASARCTVCPANAAVRVEDGDVKNPAPIEWQGGKLCWAPCPAG